MISCWSCFLCSCFIFAYDFISAYLLSLKILEFQSKISSFFFFLFLRNREKEKLKKGSAVHVFILSTPVVVAQGQGKF